jgi:di/tricarboxylate transporter
MLIIEIALGIVLAVVVLMFLPQIFSIGIWAAVVALVLALVAGVIFLASEYRVVALVIAIAIVIGAIFFVGGEYSKGDFDEEKKRRKNLGYDD